ncbi:hypothetical protein HSR122_0195 [Halapricum desulfuricans]|uniref:Uncharacterized protein n=1 Tax=Halapricum desulfuricans TaxID=2841257 RepID=A0A897N3R9_9EURY|nr:hypothetical protein HSR122_0195 [Halapricum desulfuricans]
MGGLHDAVVLCDRTVLFGRTYSRRALSGEGAGVNTPLSFSVDSDASRRQYGGRSGVVGVPLFGAGLRRPL